MGKLSDNFNKTSVGAGAIGLLEHAVKNGNKDVMNRLLGLGADVNSKNNQPAPAPSLPMGHPPGYVPPKRQAQDSTEKQMERLGEIEVLPAVNVRKRTAAERGKKGIGLLKPAQIRRRKRGGSGEGGPGGA
ncbi:MAG: ankyrin repeat domain-containing protein [Alphaproteobacteria bacterium]|nr:ankyrin repeat domain-containing protein [Alphaproteobacteria bacterium]